MTDEQIKTAVRQAFIAVEKGFFQSLDDALAEKTELQLQMPEVECRFKPSFQDTHSVLFPCFIWNH